MQIALLVPQPPLALLYLTRLRFGRVAPTFFPLLLLALFPLAALLLAAWRLRRSEARAPGLEAALVGLSIAELVWAMAGLMLVAVALHSARG